ncbi:type I glyceraldehyde-3-phosphate dehydrogenase [Thalassospira lucentensis]|jgi:glyceraldehyde 3-phosphate dehydrogenase|uniref:type I glyceraldehyde-3-phosphate dehydrogenase n=1 Tax=Thalassospira lucentensis TaxID=168935 RepID=UPI0003B45A11|nr:type I glyceraldehyde-3-phosphate dehydrogenase [Thalassospira lucentensis]RCK27583.1 glyceraldehyde-3-phosphate dehydrogenase [Thalassospira lucentensis MCCC 1A00383 = DSM 14000]|tara:strand:+ start:1453 stop:2460 length:1008 start_codon:yes stop_codon:yes gene_type:complete
MAIRVAINGFGRIGRLVLRSIVESGRTDVEVVAINDLGDVSTNAHLLKYDSVHGVLANDVKAEGENLVIDGKAIKVCSERDPANLPWAALNVDIAFECTGIFLDEAGAGKHLTAGAKRVLISAPAKGDIKTVVYGVNSDSLSASDVIVSNASCTTNCLAPVADVLNKTVGITKGFMTTVHAFTGDQNTVDSLHKDMRRARSASLSMIPTSTGAAKAVGLVLPELNGKLDGTSVRVPTPNVSMIDLTFVAGRDTTVDEINAAIKEAANGPLKGVLGVCDEPLVSIDFNHNPNSSTFDVTQTQVIGGNFVRILSWYDNEWGFSNRMSDTAVAMAKFL